VGSSSGREVTGSRCKRRLMKFQVRVAPDALVPLVYLREIHLRELEHYCTDKG